ncbi:MAG: arylsulfatase [Bacteroidales bacterium]|nr:arylsulfatase [Bacteroidales bacterium]
MKNIHLIFLLLLLGCSANLGAQDRTVLPIPAPKPPVYTELDIRNTTPPQRFEVKAPEGAPNVVVILIDDMGFGVSDAFGGPVSMPTLDKLANEGLRYTRFHTTSLCAPTRVALLTGYNHHSNNMGSITETTTSYPGDNAIRPQTITPLAEVLRQNGYNTAQFGKCHETPSWEISPAGPQDRWPIRSGFEKFYGFLGAETNEYAPLIYDGVTQVEVPNDPDYHFTTDMTNKAISWIKAQKSLAPAKPFFLYYAPGATHAPHQVPKEWIDKYYGKFDQGWDKLREETLERQKKLGIVPENTQLAHKPAAISNWDSLSGEEKKLFARQMETYAGFAEHTDQEIGRLIDAMDKMGILDNTVVIYIAGDNGNSAEGLMKGMSSEMMYFNQVPESVPQMMEHYDDWGSPSTYPHFAAGWAVAMDAPFTWTKQIASDFGGTRSGMVIYYPKEIAAKGEIRDQFSHVIDIAPTIYEITGIPAPAMVNGIEQDPIEGTSLAYTFNDPQAPEQHHVQYFEIYGNRAVYDDGWFARTVHRPPWLYQPPHTLQDDRWELYNTREDFSLSKDLAASYPDRVTEMEKLFMEEAAKYHVLPIDDRTLERRNPALVGRPTVMAGRTTMTLTEGMKGMGPDIFISLGNTSYTITADIEVPEKGNGVLVCQGGRFGGISFYLREGKPAFTYNYLGKEMFEISSPETLTPGKHILLYTFAYDGGGPGKGGTSTLTVDGKQVGQTHFPKTQQGIFSMDDGADVGTDEGTRVTDYGISPTFNGQINGLRIDIQKQPQQQPKP